jgi:hypothetical protein
MALELPLSLLVWGFYLLFLLSFLCPLERKEGDKAETYQFEEQK